MEEQRVENGTVSTVSQAKVAAMVIRTSDWNVTHVVTGADGMTGAHVARAAPKTAVQAFNHANATVRMGNVKWDRRKKLNLAI